MISLLDTDPIDLDEYAGLRTEVRGFLGEHSAATKIGGWVGSWDGYDRDFTKSLGDRGWIGLAIPEAYGGHEKSVLERFVVLEELLAGGAPVAAHWIADRQTAPLLLRFGTEEQRQQFLPGIAAGDLSFAIGMSEPDSGSDLAALRTRATKVDGGWVVNGTKVWTSYAHWADWMIALVRTTTHDEENRHAGLSQILIDLKNDGVGIRPITNLAGRAHFNEIVFEDVFVPDDRLVGGEGHGWQQVLSELAFERSGPDRFLSTFRLVVALVRAVGPDPDRYQAIALGGLVARLMAVRRMSMQVAGMLDAGEMPNFEAAIVKDVGTGIEQTVPEIARLIVPDGPTRTALFDALLEFDMKNCLSFTIRGGTREVLRGIIARGLGLR